MIKPVQRQPQPDSTPVSSTQAKKRVEGESSQQLETVEKVKRTPLNFGAGRHNVTKGPANSNLTALTHKIAERSI